MNEDQYLFIGNNLILQNDVWCRSWNYMLRHYWEFEQRTRNGFENWKENSATALKN